MRDTLFVSHANPEDNQFSLWLALRLAREGYPVWCDLTQLLGGEPFWSDIEQAIRDRTLKFVFVLSKSSNHKPGSLRELSLALTVQRTEKLRDFVLPLRLDDLAHSEINIQLHNLNAIDLSGSWARGLDRLLAKLRKDGVRKSERFTPAAVSEWWRTGFGAQRRVKQMPDDYVSNWFPMRSLPEVVYYHELQGSLGAGTAAGDNRHVPAHPFRSGVLALAGPGAFGCTDEQSQTVVSSREIPLSAFLDPQTDAFESVVPSGERKKLLTRLLGETWLHAVRQRGLVPYELSNHRFCAFFPRDLVAGDRLVFRGVDETSSWRQVAGFKTVRRRDGSTRARYWHFALQARPRFFPEPMFYVHSHVLFSYDGRTVWASKKLLHRARRSQCRDWWNDDWRDRMLAAMQWLGDEDGLIRLDVGGELQVEVDSSPLRFRSPVSYEEPKVERRPPEPEAIETADTDSDDDPG